MDLRDSKEKKKKKQQRENITAANRFRTMESLDLASVFPGFHWA